MAPKKAAKHASKKTAPKKAAKKVAPKRAAKKTAGRKHDMQRCYEHFGRVSALLPMLGTDERALLVKLGSLAQQLLRQSASKDAADTLRAAEHIAFGRLATHAGADASLTEGLRNALDETYTHMVERAEEHIATHETTGPVLTIYNTVRIEAKKTYRTGNLRAAVELARGAEALAHIKAKLTGRLRTTDMKALETA